jgi:ring-1,2-phenylacetyl-CoA epoxidase subunit PaaC
MKASLFKYTLSLADNALLMGQRNSEWTGHGPVLEQDIAITNISLDYLGQARNFYQYAAALFNNSENKNKNVNDLLPRLWKTFNRKLEEDDLAFLRDEHQYLNVLLTELPKGDWAVTVLRQFFLSAFQSLQYESLKKSSDEQLAAIAEKSIKEVAYHLRWSSEWVVRLGDGTEESRSRMQNALSVLWNYTGELFEPAPYELDLAKEDIIVSPATFKPQWMKKVEEIFAMATLSLPKTGWIQSGGKTGIHTEHLGYLLAEMQYMQRTFPNLTW